MARPRTNIRERIVRAARHEFLQRGVAATPLRAISRRARTSIGMIYYYFPSKQRLFLAVIEEPYARIVDSIGVILGSPEPVRDRIHALFRRIATATPDEADTFRLVLSEALRSTEIRAGVLARAWRGHLPLVLRAMEDGKREGVFDPRVPSPLLGLLTLVVGLVPQVAQRALPPGLFGDNALPDRLADLLLDGIGRARGDPSAR